MAGCRNILTGLQAGSIIINTNLQTGINTCSCTPLSRGGL